MFGINTQYSFPSDFQVTVTFLMGLTNEIDTDIYKTYLGNFFHLIKHSNLALKGVLNLVHLFLSIENINAFIATAMQINELPEASLVGPKQDSQWFISKKAWVFESRNVKLIGAYLLFWFG